MGSVGSGSGHGDCATVVCPWMVAVVGDEEVVVVAVVVVV